MGRLQGHQLPWIIPLEDPFNNPAFRKLTNVDSNPLVDFTGTTALSALWQRCRYKGVSNRQGELVTHCKAVDVTESETNPDTLKAYTLLCRPLIKRLRMEVSAVLARVKGDFSAWVTDEDVNLLTTVRAFSYIYTMLIIQFRNRSHQQIF